MILLGAIILSLPVSSRDGTATPFINSLFTSGSAFCVTGLVVYDTYTHWSSFGQLTILLLIQIGGLGFMTVVTLFSMFLRRKIGLRERRLLKESANTMKIGGIVLLIKRILKGTFWFESLGTLILTVRFYPEMGLKKAFYNGLFHSVSAFCNAGFDIMGKYGQFSSLTRYSEDITVNITIMSLIVIGGIGFIVLDDVFICKFCFKKYLLQTKIVLLSTSILIFGGALLFYIFEADTSMINMNIKERILASLFQSVTPRTAGFNTIDITKLSESGSFLTIILMIIGGSPGSTAGGIKTTTFVALLFGALCSAKNTSDISIFKRRIEEEAIKKACSITVIYILTTISAVMIICATQNFSLKQVLFEVYSAASTVGLTTGITPDLNNLSKTIIIFLMYFGKVGSLSMALVFGERKETVSILKPVEKLSIG
jgi:trk system potassium uptake protein TrkH